QRDLTIDECEVDEQLFVRADRQRFVQVLLNLLSNAVKYNRSQGTVSVLCEATEGDDVVRIGIRDTGPGIPAEKVERLFIPFDRLGAEQSQEEGTGLGLALSKRLVEAMDGALEVESEVGEGSTFWVELPRAEEPAAWAKTASAEPGAPGAGEAERPAATLLYIE